MALRKCCVVDCNATNRTHRLFSFPKDDKLRQLWLSFLIPVNPLLSGLSKEQLVNKRVCQKHFDRHQFDKIGNRLQHGYPCLFSTKEIQHGIPLSLFASDHLSDHSYCSQTTTEDATEMIVVEGDHSYAVSTSTAAQSHEPMDIAEDALSFQSNIVQQPWKIDLTGDHTNAASTSTAAQSHEPMDVAEGAVSFRSNIVQQPLKVGLTGNPAQSQSKERKLVVKRMVPSLNAVQKHGRNYNKKCTSFIKKMKRLANTENKKERTFQERYSDAKDLSQDSNFLRNISKLPKHAQTFLFMQLKMVGKKKKALRFTTDEKLLSLSLMKESPKGYRFLKKIFTLPSKRTLNRLAEKILFKPGINENMFLLLERKAMKWDTKKKLCSIVFDEVALTPHLTYVESQDEVKGFKDLGDERSLKFSDHALVFMVRGLCASWRQPIAYYFCEGTISSPQLVQILKLIVSKLSHAGLIPLALICDQGSTFRTAINILRKETERERILNNKHNDGSIEISGQQLNVVFDPPHLLKGIRNNLLNKNMIFNGKIASWDDIITVYNKNCLLGHTTLNKNLTDQHVIPDKIKKMKVILAAQVLSEKTSAMLKYTALFDRLKSGEHISKTMETTGEMVAFFDKLFDSVNGSRKTSTRGKLRGAIKPTSEHITFWQDAKETLKNIKYVDNTSKRAITHKKVYYVRVPSLDGWIITLESLERIAKLLFNKYGVEYLYPRNLNQDPLENFFGRIRAINYRNVNPDCYTFINSYKSLLISNVMGPHSIYSNCEEDDGETIVDFFNLLKCDPSKGEDKENIYPLCEIQSSSSGSNSEELFDAVINEKIKVHASAYTAGYICRKMSKKNNCKKCKKTYTALEKENIHDWIAHREYKRLKNSNLSYSSKAFLMIYRDISEIIHSFMNMYAHIKNVGKTIKNIISKKIDLSWLGCEKHNKTLLVFFLNLIVRLQVHNWCNIINKILRGALDEKFVNKMKKPQKLALEKYKANKLRKKKINK